MARREMTAGMLLIWSLVFLVPFPVSAKLSVVTVEVEGLGPTKNDASLDALTQAISQVNGAQVAAQTMSSVRETVSESGAGETSELTEAFSKDVQAFTKGVVESWSVLSASRNPELNNLWIVTVRANVSKYKTSKQLKRLRMAVVPFRIAANANSEDAEKFRRAFGRGLENYLTQSRRFAMLDRGFISEQSGELNFIAEGGTATAELARLGNRVGTDYLIVGEIEDAGVNSQTRTMGSTGQSFTSTTASGTISYRIIDVATTQIKFSDTVSISVSSNQMGDAGRRLADRTGQSILNAIYPVKILSAREDSVTLGQGGKTIKLGQKYKIIKLGKRLTDPYTKEVIGREEVQVGLVQVTDVQSKSSTANVLEASVDLADGREILQLIIRPILGQEMSTEEKASANVKKVSEKGKQAVKNIEEASADEW